MPQPKPHEAGLYILVTTHQRFLKAFHAASHQEAMASCEAFRTSIFRGWTVIKQNGVVQSITEDRDEGVWHQIGSNTFNLLDSSGIVRYQLFQYNPE